MKYSKDVSEAIKQVESIEKEKAIYNELAALVVLDTMVNLPNKAY